MPARSGMDPADMVAFLPHVILLDVLRGGELDFRFRLVGTYFGEFWGADPTGRCLRHLEGKGPGSRMWSELEAAVVEAKPRSSSIPYVGPKREVYGVEDCIMPLAEDGVTVDMLFVTCEYLLKGSVGTDA